MGLFSKIKNPFKSVDKWMEKNLGWLDVTKQGKGGLGDIVTFGMGAQSEATRASQRARDLAQKQYADQTAAAQAEAQRIANLEEERKRKLLLYGTQKPSTMIGGYLGIGGTANVSRPGLG